MQEFKNKVALSEALAKLKKEDKEFISFFSHGSLDLELYQPKVEDKQQPHQRDEVYIISTGKATFMLEGEYTEVKAGDFLFVAANKEHQFTQFSDDFSTWVLFYGPQGGEKDAK